MKPNFALSLSIDGIRLLQRVAGGWSLVGETPLDAPDLGGALADLRAAAMALSPEGMQTKLLIPNDQIKYLSLDTGRASDDDILEAVAGATPYALDELVYDASKGGGRTYIAVLAKETLSEAEAFAVEHGMGPVCFAAVPEPFTFMGEPMFGASQAVGTTQITRDENPVVIVAAPVIEPVVEPIVETVVEPELEPVILDTPAFGSRRSAPNPPEPVEDPVGFSSGRVSARPSVEQDAPTSDPEITFASSYRSPNTPDVSSAAPARHEPSLSAPRPSDITPADGPTLSLGGAQRETQDADLIAAPSITGGGAAIAPSVPAPEPAPNLILDQPPAPIPAPAPKTPKPRRSPGQFLSRRKGGAQPPPQTAPVDTTPAEPDESSRMTVFGARKPPKPKVNVGGKPRYLGLILTAILLIFLAAVAALAALSEDGLAGWFNRAKQDVIVASSGPVVVPVTIPSIVIDAAAIDEASSQIAIAMRENETLGLANQTPSLSLTPPPGDVLSPDEAQRLYASTGVWQRAPRVPVLPRPEIIGTLYTGAIDPNIAGTDAIALPALSAALTDASFFAPQSPPAFGTRFARDERGFILATSSGVMTPNGVLVIAGRPSIVPPLRPGTITGTALASATIVTPETATPDGITDSTAPQIRPETLTTTIITAGAVSLNTLRPVLRPTDLAENAERNTLGGLTRSELASFRPKMRPDGLAPPVVEVSAELIAEASALQTPAEALASATPQAIATSRRPDARPRNFQRIVAAAQRAPATAVASAAPRTVAPSGPISTTVAAQATQRNAINLRQINLIGVYGQPSDRSALVRLSNGRYVKVGIGDRLDGGRVSSIGDSDLTYTKRSRNITLDIAS